MDRLIPFVELAQRFGLVTAPHAGGYYSRYAASCTALARWSVDVGDSPQEALSRARGLDASLDVLAQRGAAEATRTQRQASVSAQREVAPRALATIDAAEAALVEQVAQLQVRADALLTIAAGSGPAEASASQAGRLVTLRDDLDRTAITIASLESAGLAATRVALAQAGRLLDLRQRRLDGMAAELAAGLHPGDECPVCGNTSVKTTLLDDLGVPTAVACIKGSGWDLARIEPPGLPAVRLAELQALLRLPALGDEAMVRALRVRLLDPAAPNPSVEALLHAFLPHKFIDHSHADAVLAVVDQPEAASLCAEVFGPDYAVVPYVMPGFALAKLAAEVHAAAPACHGLLLLGHGLFSFGGDARESYERHLVAVTRAEQFIARASHATVQVPAADPRDFIACTPCAC